MSTQSKTGSFIEACSNTAIGFITTLLLSPLIYKLCGVCISYQQMGWATVCFTIVSVIRSYIVRRFFNNKKI